MSVLQVQIFFVGYLLGYLFCAYALDVGVSAYQEHFDHTQQGWQLRKFWRWRLLTHKRWGRLIIAIYSLAWPWLLGAGVIEAIRQSKAKPSEFDFNRIRHCHDPLGAWCEASPYAVIYVTVMRCEHDYESVAGTGFVIILDDYPLCLLGLIRGDRQRCYDPDHYDPQFCQGVALQ